MKNINERLKECNIIYVLHIFAKHVKQITDCLGIFLYFHLPSNENISCDILSAFENTDLPGESVFEIEGKRYFLSLIEEPETTVEEDVEHDPELKHKLLQAKMDILEGNVYSTEEIIEMIDQGKL